MKGMTGHDDVEGFDCGSDLCVYVYSTPYVLVPLQVA